MYRSAIVNETGDAMFWRDDLRPEEKQISTYINQYGKTMAKAIGRIYYTM